MTGSTIDLRANERPKKIAWEGDNTQTNIRTSQLYERIGLRADSLKTVKEKTFFLV